MNRYAVSGVLADARAGKTVIVLSPDLTAASRLLERLDPLSKDASQIIRAAGRAEIRFVSGGRVRLLSRRSNVRGLTADVVVTDGVELSTDEQHEVIPVLMSTRGELINA